MATLRLDYEKLYETFKDQNKKIIGVFTLQYPIYCIHATITDETVDPLDHIDSLIVKIIKSKNNVSLFTLSALLGVSKAIVESRINILISENLLLKNSNIYTLTEIGEKVYVQKSEQRVHIRSYDFYVDGITMEPLKKIFYNSYKSKLISEYDNYFRTTKSEERIIERSMKPDLVHYPINNDLIIENIKNICKPDRDAYGIPPGFREVNELSHTKMTFQILVVASTDGLKIQKELIDGFAAESFLENSDYYTDIKKNIDRFENNIYNKIQNLIFCFQDPIFNKDGNRKTDEMIVSNWQEIDKYKDYSDKVFSYNFSQVKSIVKQKMGVDFDFPENLGENQKLIEITVDSKMLKGSDDRSLLISNLMRGRDYIFDVRYTNHNVQLLYFYYTTSDKVVEKIIDINFLIDKIGHDEIEKKVLLHQVDNCKATLRELLLLGGNYEILERFDIEQHML